MKINNVEIIAKEFDFNLICEMEDNGISLEDIQHKPMSFIRVYISACAGVSVDEAGDMLNKHFENGYSADEIMKTIQDKILNSGFLAQKTPKKKN